LNNLDNAIHQHRIVCVVSLGALRVVRIRFTRAALWYGPGQGGAYSWLMPSLSRSLVTTSTQQGCGAPQGRIHPGHKGSKSWTMRKMCCGGVRGACW